MITAVHTLIYSDDTPATRRFLRDVLRWPFVADGGDDTEDGSAWMIFGTGRGEMGVHPTMTVADGREYRSERHHQITLMCDDIEATRLELEGRGATFAGPTEDHGFGLVAVLEVPGADPLQVYEPRHMVAYPLDPPSD